MRCTPSHLVSEVGSLGFIVLTKDGEDNIYIVIDINILSKSIVL